MLKTIQMCLGAFVIMLFDFVTTHSIGMGSWAQYATLKT